MELLSTDDDEEAKGTKRPLDTPLPPQTPEVIAQQYFAYGGGARPKFSVTPEFNPRPEFPDPKP